jgi:hypothetical protein
MMGNDYFIRYQNRETFIMENYISDNIWLASLVKEVKKDNTQFHDLLIVLQNDQKLTVEVKEDEYYWYSRTGNIGLDYLSAFEFKNQGLRRKWLSDNYWIKSKDIQEFKNEIIVSKYGKLITCDADLQLYVVYDKETVKFSQLYSNNKLKQNNFVSYLEKNYNLRVNKKNDYGLKDSWESAAFFVNPLKDLKLKEAEINDFDQLKEN